MLLRSVRAVFVALAGILAWAVCRFFSNPPMPHGEAVVYGLIAAGAAGALVGIDVAFRRQFLRSFVAVAFGVILGMLVSGFVLVLVGIFFLPAVELPAPPLTLDKMLDALRGAAELAQSVIPLVTLTVCYLTVSIVLRTKDEFRFMIPYVDFAEQGRTQGGMLLDSSVLVDGRIVDVVETMKLSDPIVVPRFVVAELQRLADSADRLVRARGRRGLDMVARLQGSPQVRFRFHEGDVPGPETVDAKLVRLARVLGGRLVTNDFNLAKVAKIEKVTVVSINELAGSLRAPYLPGEKLSLRIVRRGEEKGQGVGYLDDGTMVVVELARDDVGSSVEAVVTSSIQTAAGRMIFGRKAGAAEATEAGNAGEGQ